MFDVERVRKDFPILFRKVNGKPLIYFDNAATSQKPRQVISAVSDFYQKHNANVHRGIHTLAEEATELYEEARRKVAKFVKAESEKEIVFVRNTTEAINLVAYTWGRLHIDEGDEILTSVMEHHSNFVPWQQLCVENGAILKVWDIDSEGRLEFEEQSGISGLVSEKTRMVGLAHASNVLGTINPVARIVSQIRDSKGPTPILIDGAQIVPHFEVDVSKLGCDFYAFSGHKMFGPMGIGVLWGRQEVFGQLPPFLFGGGMIKSVALSGAEWAESPEKFEAGTPDVAGAVGLVAAIDYLESLGWKEIRDYELKITGRLISGLGSIEGVTIYGPKKTSSRVPAVSFTVLGVHPHDVAQFLNDEYAIAVRAGQHCAGPLHDRLGVAATVRASLAFYNTEEEVEIFLRAVRDLIAKFG